MSCDVIPMDIDEPYCNYTFSDSATSEGTIGKDYTELSRYDNYKDIYGENCLDKLSYDEVEDIYIDVFGEDPDPTMNKHDMIRCIERYYE